MTLTTVSDWYKEAKGQHYGLTLLIEFLVYEKKVLKMEDATEKLTYFLQDRFSNKMNEYLLDYERKNLTNRSYENV